MCEPQAITEKLPAPPLPLLQWVYLPPSPGAGLEEALLEEAGLAADTWFYVFAQQSTKLMVLSDDNCEEVSRNLSFGPKTYCLFFIPLFTTGSLAVTIY